MADPITATIAVASTALSAMSSIQQGYAADANAKSQQNMLNARAQQSEMKAVEEGALAQQRAKESRRQAMLKSSRAQAISAASGGGSFDPSIVNLMGDIAAEGEYNAGIDMYEGDVAADDLRYSAELNRYEGREARRAGKAAKRAGFMKAASTVLKSGSSLQSKYGSGGSEKIYWNDGTSGMYKTTSNTLPRGYA